jgi:hypothetical protein
VRHFSTGATRDDNQHKLDYAGFNDPLTMRRFAEYMHEHRFQADGQVRESDNWQKGIPKSAYMESMYRHFHDVWALDRNFPEVATEQDIEKALCALWFNVRGYLFEVLMEKLEANHGSTAADCGGCVDVPCSDSAACRRPED